MMKTYTKPVVTIDNGMAEGVYAASGAQEGTLNVTYMGAWDKWTNGGKGVAQISWSGIEGTITVNVSFNDTIDQAESNFAGTQCSCAGKTATFVFASTADNPMTVGVHINHKGGNIDNLQMTGYTYSVN